MASGMGFFFLLAGYFTPGSYDREGGASFLRDRLITVALYPLLKFAIAVLIALPLCFLANLFIRKIPFANRIL